MVFSIYQKLRSRTESPSFALVRLSALGDIIKALPVVVALRKTFPHASLTWFVEDRFESFLQGVQGIDEVVPYRRALFSKRSPTSRGTTSSRMASWLEYVPTYLRELRRRHFDVLFDFQGNLKSATHCQVLKAHWKVGFAKGYARENSHLAYTLRLTPRNYPCYGVQKNLDVLEQLGFPLLYPLDVEWKIPPGVQKEIDNFLGKISVGNFKGVVLHPTTSLKGAKAKEWPLERYTELAQKLMERGWTPLFSIDPHRDQIKEILSHRLKNQFFAFDKDFTFPHLIDLLTKVRLFIGSDSAPLHLAYLLRVPSVALLGACDPRFFLPPDHSVGLWVNVQGKVETVLPREIQKSESPKVWKSRNPNSSTSQLSGLSTFPFEGLSQRGEKYPRSDSKTMPAIHVMDVLKAVEMIT